MRTRRRRDSGRAWPGILLVLLVCAGFAGWGWWAGSLWSVPIRPHCTATALGVTAELEPEQATNAATIAAIAVRRGLPARAATIAIATSMQESKLVNIAYGDRDSLGLFQQRPSQGWGTVEQVQDPVYATNAFYDALVKVKNYETLPITEAAQKVQRSAYPSAYATREPVARLWASTLTGHSPGGLSCVFLDVPDDLSELTPGDDGLTERTRALRSAAAVRLGQTGTVSGDEGTRLRYQAVGRDNERTSWAIAQWAVASGDVYYVTRVRIGNQQWRRDHSTKGWTVVDETLGAGIVLIEVA